VVGSVVERGDSVRLSEYLSLISGESRGPLAAMMRCGLSLLSCGYRTAVVLRNVLYNRRWKQVVDVGVPVVSIGNLTAGGTGKTPFVAEIVARLREHNRNPAILSRGYRATTAAGNDEKQVLDRLCPGTPHVQNRDRVAGAKLAIGDHGANVLVLDDGFQHRRLARTLDIVLIDATNPWGHGHLLPRGLLREPVTGLRRAHLAVLTRVDAVSRDQCEQIRAEIAQIVGQCSFPVVEVAYPAGGLINAAGERMELSTATGQRVAAFCGLGNPAAFRTTVESLGVFLEDALFVPFPDHHHFGDPTELQSLALRAARAGATLLLCSLKDLVKIGETEIAGLPLFAIEIVTRVLRGEEHLDACLAALVESRPEM